MRPGRLGLSAIDKREIWSRWRAGQTLTTTIWPVVSQALDMKF